MTGAENIYVAGVPVWTITADRYAEVMRMLPKQVRYFMMYDAASSFSEEAVLQYFHKYGEEATLRKLRHDQRMETMNIYGQEHPNAMKPTKV